MKTAARKLVRTLKTTTPNLFLSSRLGLLFWLDPYVEPLDEVALAQSHHDELTGIPAGAEQLNGRPQFLGNADLVGKTIARAAGQYAHDSAGAHNAVGDLVLRAVAAVAHHQINAGLDSSVGQVGSISVSLGDTHIPIDAIRTEHVT